MPKLQVLFATKVTTRTTLYTYKDERAPFVVHRITATDHNGCETEVELFTHDLNLFTPTETVNN